MTKTKNLKKMGSEIKNPEVDTGPIIESNIESNTEVSDAELLQQWARESEALNKKWQADTEVLNKKWNEESEALNKKWQEELNSKK